MSVQETLETALNCLGGERPSHRPDAEALEEARAWLARTEVLLDWIAQHPKLVEINCEAARLVNWYRAPVREGNDKSAVGEGRSRGRGWAP